MRALDPTLRVLAVAVALACAGCATAPSSTQATMTQPTANPASPELPAIKATIAEYLRGHALGAGDPMRNAFLPTAHIEGNRQGKFSSWDLDTYRGLFNGKPAPDEATRVRTIDWIDVDGDAAAAKATLVHGAITFTDYFVLLKVDGQWRIANKVYHGKPTLAR